MFNWQCGYCGHFATLSSSDIDSTYRCLFEASVHGDVTLVHHAIRCPNSNCSEITLKVHLAQSNRDQFGDLMAPSRFKKSWDLLPTSNAKPQPDYIPAPIVEDYEEACLILKDSPKAAATLARRCLQGMIREFWGINKKSLFDEIAALENLVRPEDWEAIDAVRQFGNIGAHMEKDVNVVVPVDEQEVALLIELIEQLFLDWYVDRHSRKERSARIVQLSKEKKSIAKGEAAAESSSESSGAAAADDGE